MITERLLKRKDVLIICGISKSTLYRMIKSEDFPSQVSISGKRSVGWRSSEVDAWLGSRERVNASSCISAAWEA
ncbi:AlpA family phage regulatory protein [Enterovibrio sp. FF113]|uniref:helix-turn-helix transcriptional regulator n=1 Tax=Enterovibrio TaxID=188143 RepID=UPI0013015C92